MSNLSLKNQQDMEDLKSKKAKELQELIDKRKYYQDEVEKVKEYQDNQAEKEAELTELKNAYEYRAEKIKIIKLEEEEEIQKRKERLREEFKNQEERDKEKAKLDAEKQISEIERNIQEQNTRLDDEVNLQNDVIEFLGKEKETIFEENIGYKKDLDANIDTVIDYAKKQYEQNLKIKDLKGKIKMLEKSLSQIVQDFEKEKELIKYQNEQIEQEQEDDINNYKEQIRLKDREIKSIKALCQMILDQRSDVEQFFLEALEQVKEEVKRRKESMKESTLPPLNRSLSKDSRFQRSSNSFMQNSSIQK
jgi:chromosome segregation ATPase